MAERPLGHRRHQGAARAMSALGQKRTSSARAANVCFGPQADIEPHAANVCLRPESKSLDGIDVLTTPWHMPTLRRSMFHAVWMIDFKERSIPVEACQRSWRDSGVRGFTHHAMDGTWSNTKRSSQYVGGNDVSPADVQKSLEPGELTCPFCFGSSACPCRLSCC